MSLMSCGYRTCRVASALPCAFHTALLHRAPRRRTLIVRARATLATPHNLLYPRICALFAASPRYAPTYLLPHLLCLTTGLWTCPLHAFTHIHGTPAAFMYFS